MAYAYNINIKHVANSLDTISEIKTRLYKNVICRPISTPNVL